MKPALNTAIVSLATLLLSNCSRSNNLLLGRVEATVGGHVVVVTDCYRTSVAPPERSVVAAQTSYHFKPCRDADVWIRGEELVVNGQSYGHLNPTDAVLVDHSVVSVQRRSSPPVPPPNGKDQGQ
jgi:hypothetical protein